MSEEQLLADCVKYSRLLGADPTLVLHGGGNTSVKTIGTDITGKQQEIMHVKGSGHDLAKISEAGLNPLRRTRLLELAALNELSDVEMVNEVRQAGVVPDAPRASVETLVHAVIPSRFVLHTHADTVVTLTNASLSDERIHEILGPGVEVLPYCKPGFDLAQEMKRVMSEASVNSVDAVVHRHHGLFTFHDDGGRAYERHLELVGRARRAIVVPSHATKPHTSSGTEARANFTKKLAELRRKVSMVAGQPMMLRQHTDPQAMNFINRPDLASVTKRGTATLEHVIRTKAEPCLGLDVTDYGRRYRQRFEHHSQRHPASLTMLDPAPRVILDRELGLVVVGRTEKEMDIVEDIYRHTMAIIESAQRIGQYRSLNDKDLFDIEYWELEQAKLTAERSSPALTGEVVMLGGENSPQEYQSTVYALRSAGATVITTDRQDGPEAVHEIVRRFGGIDIVITSDEDDPQWWDEAEPLLALSPRGARSVKHGTAAGQTWAKVIYRGGASQISVPDGEELGLVLTQLCTSLAPISPL